MTADAEQVERVTHMAMTIDSAEPSPEASKRWSQRADALAAWLSAEWQQSGFPGRPEVADGSRRGSRSTSCEKTLMQRARRQ